MCGQAFFSAGYPDWLESSLYIRKWRHSLEILPVSSRSGYPGPPPLEECNFGLYERHGMIDANLHEPISMTLMFSKFQRFLPFVMAALTVACAPLTVPPKEEYPVGRARLALPPGAWQDLGASDEVVPGSVSRVPLQTRAVGLRSAQGGWLAVLRVQTNRTGDVGRFPLGASDCPPQQDVIVEDAAAGSPVRADCLRLKRWGSSAQWLDKNRPDLVQWLGRHQILLNQPYSYVSFRYVTQAGVWVTVDALVDQRLLRPKTQNNEEFLVAGRPALQWGHDLAHAARLSVAMMDGYLAIPPFPYPAPLSSP